MKNESRRWFRAVRRMAVAWSAGGVVAVTGGLAALFATGHGASVHLRYLPVGLGVAAGASFLAGLAYAAGVSFVGRLQGSQSLSIWSGIRWGAGAGAVSAAFMLPGGPGGVDPVGAVTMTVGTVLIGGIVGGGILAIAQRAKSVQPGDHADGFLPSGHPEILTTAPAAHLNARSSVRQQGSRAIDGEQ